MAREVPVIVDVTGLITLQGKHKYLVCPKCKKELKAGDVLLSNYPDDIRPKCKKCFKEKVNVQD